jgi:hypothetical protein
VEHAVVMRAPRRSRMTGPARNPQLSAGCMIQR